MKGKFLWAQINLIYFLLVLSISFVYFASDLIYFSFIFLFLRLFNLFLLLIEKVYLVNFKRHTCLYQENLFSTYVFFSTYYIFNTTYVRTYIKPLVIVFYWDLRQGNYSVINVLYLLLMVVCAKKYIIRMPGLFLHL